MRTDLLKQEIPRFIGVNLRQDRMDLADEELAKAINADLHSAIGTIVLRLGRSKQFTSPLNDLVVRRLGKVNAIRYQVAGQSVYRDQAKIIDGLLSDNLITTIVPYRPFNDDTTWAFICDNDLMKKDDGTNCYKWGIEAPTAAPTLGSSGSGLTGTFQFVYTYARIVAGAVAHESNPSPSASITITDDQIDVSALVASTDEQVTHIRLYRTVAGGSSYLFDQNIANGTTTATSSQIDIALGVEVEDDNDVPPNCAWGAVYNETVFLCRNEDNPHFLYHTKRLRPESQTEYIEIGNADDPLQCCIPTSGALGVLSRLTKYRVTGNATSGYVPIEHQSRRGTPSPAAAIETEYGVVFVARDGIFSTNFFNTDIALAQEILPLFFGETVNGMDPINWTYASKFCASAYKNRYYLSYASGSNTNPDRVMVYSNDTKKFYFYDHPLNSFFVEEDIDMLVGGSTDGFVYTLEDGSDDAGSNIALDVETKDYFGQETAARKLFLFYRVDAYIPSGTLSAKVYVDGALKTTGSITGDRTVNILRMPEKCIGFRWRLNFTYSGTGRVKIYGCSMLSLPLGAS